MHLNLPAYQEHTESCQQESDEDTNPHLHGERRQQAEGTVFRISAFMHDEAETSLNEGGGHVHKAFSDSSDGQWGHSQVSILVDITTTKGSESRSSVLSVSI